MNVEKDAKFRLGLSSGEIYEGWVNEVEVEVGAPHSSMAPYFTITLTGWNLEITSAKNEKPIFEEELKRRVTEIIGGEGVLTG